LGNKFSLIGESINLTVLQIVNDQLGKKYQKFFPFIFSLFNFILIGNLLGMIPYSFTVTSHFALALSLSFSILIGVTLYGIVKHKLNFLSLFLPTGTPLGLVPLLVLIESVLYCTKALSLGIRLSANLLSGHMLLKIISGFI
jgi:F-type H+-transporting ATPase subunit a